VAAGAVGGSGRYQVRWDFTPREISTCTRQPRIELNGGYIGVLGEESCRGAGGGALDSYEFSLPQAGTVAVFMTAGDLDPFLTLEDTAAVLRVDDNGYGESDAMIVQHLAAGTYRLRASSANEKEGVYRVDVIFVPGERSSGCAPLKTLEPGETVRGLIYFTSCQYEDDTFADIYRIETAESVERRLEIESTRFAAELLLLDEQGNLLERRAGPIERTLEAGVHFVVAKPAEDYRSVGAYTLTMR
jgi:hypothetical protein